MAEAGIQFSEEAITETWIAEDKQGKERKGNAKVEERKVMNSEG